MMSINYLVSIIIPVFNAEKHLSETIKSAINQSWQNKEIIIVDNGSTDQSLAIAKLFESDQVKIFTQPNRGASAARNLGLSKARGMYIQFLDSDDLISERKIEAQLNVIGDKPGFIGLCKTTHFLDGQDPATIKSSHEWYAEGTNDTADFLIKLYGGHLIGPTYGGMIQPNAWLTPKAILDKAGPWNEKLSVDDDGEYFCRVLLVAEGIAYAMDATNYYRKYKTRVNLSSQKKTTSNQSLFIATQLKAKYLLATRNNEQSRNSLSRLFWEVAFSLYNNDRKIAAEAEIEAKRLAPNLHIEAFNKGIAKTLSKLLGWKFVKTLQNIKSNLLSKNYKLD